MSEAQTQSQPGSQPQSLDEACLTQRELEVLQLIATGLQNCEIAAALDIKAKTLETHITRIFYKLVVQNRTEAALWAVRVGVS
jgi:DNA-binding NarL/FixJ family response regulator